MYRLIEKKKNGGELTREELEYIVSGYMSGEIPDYQMSAFLMAVCLKGMTDRETYSLTVAMRDSGECIDMSGVNGVVVDKHSTGGVGDKVSLVMGPMVSACGVPVAKLSGRGLGHTGGTIDKLESFEGFNVNPTEEEFIRNVNDIGISWAGQTANLAPADKKIYALRDVTATVDSIPLIASSIMSKKLASGAAGIVLDVTYGSGAFMRTAEQAVKLAELMIKIGKKEGRKMSAVITYMDEPLGYAVGNAMEAAEAIQCLKGYGPEDVMETALVLGSHMLVLNGCCEDLNEARKMLIGTVEDGSALEKMALWVERQHGNKAMVYNENLLPKAKYEKKILFDENFLRECSKIYKSIPEKCYLSAIDGKVTGQSVQMLGGGRTRKDEKIDLSVGVKLCRKVGDIIKPGDALAVLYGNSTDRLDIAYENMIKAYKFSEKQPKKHNLIFAEKCDIVF